MTAAKIFLAVLLTVPFGFSTGLRPLGEAAAPVAKTSPAPASGLFATSSSAAFAATVRPVLAAKCTPCHEPGGKMYASLPFDKSETIASHREGVLKRLKGDDRAAVEKWLATLPQAQAPAASK